MNLKSDKAITLVAIIITIIILLILAGVSLTLVLGENGLIDKAKASVNKYQMASEVEQEQLENIEEYMDTYDLANGGKSKTIKYLGFPDYTNRIALASNEKFVADENMYIIVDTTGKQDTYMYYGLSIKIDGTLYTFYQEVSGTDWPHPTNGILPIKRVVKLS